MIWLAPGAFAAFLLLAGPIAIHLLLRRKARRLMFPAAHFVPAMQAAAATLRRPSDIGLLLLRLAIVAVAVLAAAGPLVMTRWRLARWDARVSRAVILDISRSMTSAEAAARLADQEAMNIFSARRIETPVLPDGVERAIGWLRSTAPSRREIVLISDFQRSALDEKTLKGIPADIGVRLIRAGAQPATRRPESPAVAGWREGIWQATATIDAGGTRATWVRRGDAATPGWVSIGANPAGATAADRALRAAIARGVPAGDAGRRLLVRFAGAEALAPPAHPVQSPWIAVAALALSRSDLLRDVEPAVKVLERDGVMVVDALIPATAFAAPSVIRAALLAVRPPAIVDSEEEVVTLSDADLARWRRDPAPVTASGNPRADDSDLSDETLARRSFSRGGSVDSDARWLWALALVLLGVEARVRGIRVRSSAASAGQAGAGETHAAA
jgi:hypothetical protein